MQDDNNPTDSKFNSSSASSHRRTLHPPNAFANTIASPIRRKYNFRLCRHFHFNRPKSPAPPVTGSRAEVHLYGATITYFYAAPGPERNELFLSSKSQEGFPNHGSEGETAFQTLLHTYLSADDVRDGSVVVEGLKGLTYHDKVAGQENCEERDMLTLDQETVSV
ncbi:hypothetical protein GN958_ATG01178 [Phytophthora infestans]|uniref:Uncharacterized protein n=1 Tax=Phytophthora infestans TaxID=4787 RepID=A0A8S9VDS2_PHYIN|nr:hypothetical protein GN958_ATG01178 [Phytophthora infestans]